MKNCAKSIPEVTLRLAKSRCIKGTGTIVRSPTDVLDVLRKLVGKDAAQESFVAVYLSPSNEVLATQRVVLGGLSQAMVDPKVLFAGALLAGAQALIVGHNHPSGDTTPSLHDDTLTQQLIEGGKLLTIRLLDHLIFSDRDSYSYVQNGRLKFS